MGNEFDYKEIADKYSSQVSDIVAANAAIYGEGKTAGTSSGPTAEFNALPFDQRMALFDVIQRKVDMILHK